jgi:hypothetical protein
VRLVQQVLKALKVIKANRVWRVTQALTQQFQDLKVPRVIKVSRV